MGMNYWGLTALAAVPAIILLYLLKQKNRDYPVSSLYLWQKTLMEIQANTPWQRLKKNILMFLQILIVSLLALALCRPYIKDFSIRENHIILILDTSLSMQIKSGDETRLDQAKKTARDLIDRSADHTEYTIVNLYAETIVEQKAIQDKSVAKEAVDSLRVTNTAADGYHAMEVIQALQKELPDTAVVLFGDATSGLNRFLGQENLNFVNLENPYVNYSMDLLSVSPVHNGTVSALSVITNHSKSDVDLNVSLYADGDVFNAVQVRILAGESKNMMWYEIPETVHILMCNIDSTDDLERDNRMWTVLQKSDIKKVLLVSEHNVFLEKILNIVENVSLYRALPKDSEGLSGYDIYMFDGYLPEKLPEDGALVLFNPPEGVDFRIIDEVENPVVKISDNTMLRYMSGLSFSVGRTKRMELPVWAEPLYTDGEWSIAFEGIRNRQRTVVFGFDLHHTDLPISTAFPVLMTNLIQTLGGRSMMITENLYAGQSLMFELNPETVSAYIEYPDGKRTTIAPPFPSRLFNDTETEGLYKLIQNTPDGEHQSLFAVNVPSLQEFRSTRQTTGEAGQGDTYQKETNQGEVPQGETEADAGSNTGGSVTPVSGEKGDWYQQGRFLELEKILLCILLLVLLIEWGVYSRGI